MRKGILFLIAGVLLALAGCAAQSSEPTGPYMIYCRSNLDYSGGGDAVCAVPVDAEGENTERVASDLLQKMLREEGEDHYSAIPADTRVLDVRIADGQAVVNLSEEYGSLSGVDLTLADYCITLTLCQLGGVDRVSVLVEGEPLPYRDSQSFTSSDALLSWMDQEFRTLRVRLFYCDAGTGALASETRILQLYEGQTKAAAVLEALLAGPESEGLVSPLPEGLTVEYVRADEGVCYVNFSAEFLENIPESIHAQEAMINVVVKSLRSISDIQAVQIAVEGETVDYYGAIDISGPLR